MERTKRWLFRYFERTDRRHGDDPPQKQTHTGRQKQTDMLQPTDRAHRQNWQITISNVDCRSEWRTGWMSVRFGHHCRLWGFHEDVWTPRSKTSSSLVPSDHVQVSTSNVCLEDHIYRAAQEIFVLTGYRSFTNRSSDGRFSCSKVEEINHFRHFFTVSLRLWFQCKTTSLWHKSCILKMPCWQFFFTQTWLKKLKKDNQVASEIWISVCDLINYKLVNKRRSLKLCGVKIKNVSDFICL